LRSKNSRKENPRHKYDDCSGNWAECEWRKTVIGQGITWVHCGERRMAPESRQSKKNIKIIQTKRHISKPLCRCPGVATRRIPRRKFALELLA
jgi:hypothetical protein